MRHCRVAILGLCLVLTAAANSQAPDDLLREAEIAFSNGQFPEALGIYLMAKQLDPDNTDVLLPLAECYLENGEPEPALPLLKQVINSRRPDPRAYLLTAQALHLTNQYELAIQAYKGYLQRIPDDDPSRPVAKADILRCGFATRWQHSEAVAFVDNLGDMVNSDSDETAPALSPNHPDRLYFSSNREGASGGKRNMEGIADPLGQRKLDLFMTEQRPQGWTAPSPLPDLLNSAAHEVIQDFNADGTVLYYFKGLHLQSGVLLTDTFRQDDSKPLLPGRFPGPVRAETGDMDLFFFNDTTALFAGRRPDGYGGTDIYLIANRHGKWEEPVNLGPQINSPWDERMPVLMPDGVTLYFCSNNARQSLGGFDIFQVAFHSLKREWSDPVNLGDPINSPADDLYFRPSSDGINAWFASNRPGGLGGLDLYAAFFKQPRMDQVAPLPDRSFFDILRDGPDLPALVDLESPMSKTPYTFKMIFFDTEEDITARQNQATLDQAAALLMAYPELHMAIQAHSDQSGTPLQYDLYYSIKRAERAQTYLLDLGVSPDQIALQGFGPQYPQAFERLQGQDNPQGRRLNRRLSLSFLQQKPLPLLLSMDAPIISTYMRSTFAEDFAATIEGLTWRVEVATAPAIYNNAAFTGLPDLMAEQLREGGQIRYSAGLFSTYSDAVKFADLLPEKGLPKGRPAPYLNGIRMNQKEVTLFLETFPELLRYLADSAQ